MYIRIFIFCLTIFLCFNGMNTSEAKKMPLVDNFLKYETVKYNNPPGSKELNLQVLKAKGQLNLNAVTSPNYKYMAFTEVYSYSQSNVILSSVYLIELNQYLSQKERILKAFVNDKSQNTIMEADFANAENFLFRTFTIIDWNSSADKILIKEKVGKNFDRVYLTNIYVYDTIAEKKYNIDAIRSAVLYYWKNKEDINLDNYKWDIQPLGWDDNYPDRVIVKAFGYYKDKKKFLGTWSCDFKGNLTLLLSLDENKIYKISQNGVYLRSEK